MRLLPILLLIPLLSVGQVAPERYWVQFTDKDNTPFSVSAPEQFLSLRSIGRRQRQQIAIDQSDLPVDPNYIAQVRNAGAEILNVSKWFNSVTVRITDPSVLQQVLQLPFVIHHEPVGRYGSPSKDWGKGAVASDKSNIELPVDADYGTALNQVEMLNGLNLHRQGLMGQGMLIAVLDAGFSGADHLAVFDSLRQNGRIIATRDFVEGNDGVYGYSTHGMSVLSTMAAYQPGVMIGTAPKASYLLLRTEDVGSEFPIEEHNWVAGAEFADSCGADIFNTSLGYTDFDDEAYNYSYSDMDGRTTAGARGSVMAARKGILVVTSAGNMGNNAWQYINTPADADSVLAIGAVTPDRIWASFSSIGPSADGRVKPNVCAQGQQAIVATPSGAVEPGNGTSFAGPILTGMAACLWQAQPEATNMQVYDAIQRSAHLYDAPTPKMGYGIPDFVRARLLLSGYSPANLLHDELMELYPIPFTDRISGTYYSSIAQDVEVRLVDGMGQTLQTLRIAGCEMCIHPIRFDGLGSLTVGPYVVEVLAKDGRFARKVVKAQR
ncbi:MAG: S8 family serine peptidase [Flavobacteriales bacterium]|nr:S8 family serine peptidase [Flavobacteriales bacterium]